MFYHQTDQALGYFLCYYIPANRDTTEMSSLLKDFKANISENLVEHFSDWASYEFLKEEIRITHIVRALKNTEVKADTHTSLDKLGNRLAKDLNALYIPEILSKRKITPALKTIEFTKRKTTIENSYCINHDFFSPDDAILVLDDIYTSGATINEITRVLKEKNSEMKIYFFTLGKTSLEIQRNEYVSFPYFIYKTLF
jgi:predicted amidophosphoribosyltransferase